MVVGNGFLVFRYNKFCTIPTYVDKIDFAVTDLSEQGCVLLHNDGAVSTIVLEDIGLSRLD